MGNSRYNPSDWAAYSASTSSIPRSTLFSSRSAPADADTKNIGTRESRDSDANPNSTPIILAVDVTGSMGYLAEKLVKKQLGPIFEEIISRNPVSDPHVMAMALGDVACDRNPVQATQFEADVLTLGPQIAALYLEGGGGGNRTESYDAAWYFAAMHTSTDAWDKRQKKGYLFTLGDEESPNGLTVDDLKRFFATTGQPVDLSPEQLLRMAEEKFHVFHLIIAEGSHATAFPDAVRKSWTDLLGQRALWVSNHEKVAEVIVSTIQITEGADAKAVAASWSGDTSLVVARATSSLVPADVDAGVVAL